MRCSTEWPEVAQFLPFEAEAACAASLERTAIAAHMKPNDLWDYRRGALAEEFSG
jgi:hypothetical protein